MLLESTNANQKRLVQKLRMYVKKKVKQQTRQMVMLGLQSPLYNSKATCPIGFGNPMWYPLSNWFRKSYVIPIKSQSSHTHARAHTHTHRGTLAHWHKKTLPKSPNIESQNGMWTCWEFEHHWHCNDLEQVEIASKLDLKSLAIWASSLPTSAGTQ